MAGSVFYKDDLISVSSGFRLKFVKDCTKELSHFEVSVLFVRPNIVTVSYCPSIKYCKQTPNVIFNEQPITDIVSPSIQWYGFSRKGFENNSWYQFLRVLVRPIIVRAVSV